MAAVDHLGQQFPRGLYHVTTADAVPSIQKHGLNNEHSETELWSNSDDWDSGSYMWDNPRAAHQYSHSIREMGHKPVVLKINPKGLDLSPDDTGSTEVKGAWHAPAVGPENIKRLTSL